MKTRLTIVATAACAVVTAVVLGVAWAQPVAEDVLATKIAWYSTLDAGLAEAARSQRPILLISAAPQCLGVPGTW